MPTPTGLSLSDEPTRETTRETAREGKGGLVALVVLLSATLAGLGYLGFQMLQRMDAVERQLAVLQARSDAAAAEARAAADRASTAETAAKAAAEGRVWAEAQTADARHEADTARQDATAAQQQATVAQQDAATAREAAVRAQAEAEAIRKRAEAEVTRLEAALGQVAETRRTALGLVMNLGSDYLKFEFDKAELRSEDRELLSRISGILMTSKDYMVSVNGHTDDVGTSEYNQKLSERRAQAVRDYLVKAGMSPDILSVEGHGKQLPLVKGSTDAARAKNRRVELGIVHTQIQYGKKPIS
jgi:outer membrane protein OmpA-like peptidoglycan-associated protein